MNEQLVQRIRNCPTLPSLPAIAVQVLELTQHAEVDLAEIARVISKDPALSSKILRTVNSSFYGRSNNVSTISHALVILGLQSVKTLVLGFSLVMHLAKETSCGFKYITYWKRSIYAATAARSLAAKIGMVQQEEAFLAALLMDLGMLVLDQLLGEEYGAIYASIESHGELAAAETKALNMTHADVGGLLAQQWNLPPILREPIAFHESPQGASDPSLQKLAELIGLGGRCADIFVDLKPAQSITAVRSTLARRYHMSEADADALLAEIGARTREIASLFEINIGSSAQYEAILKRANEALIEITLQSQQQATRLQHENIELQQKAMRDGLTGLANRATFDQFLEEQYAAAHQKGTTLALLMLDLDKFKKVNDQHGHPAGDVVLRATAKLLASAARTQDCAARFGGEEMVLALPDTSRGVASAIAESIRRAVAARPVLHGTTSIPITASIGVALYEPGCPFKTPAHLLKAADLALYNAKESGRNCVKIFSLKPSESKPPELKSAAA